MLPVEEGGRANGRPHDASAVRGTGPALATFSEHCGEWHEQDGRRRIMAPALQRLAQEPKMLTMRRYKDGQLS